MSDFLFYSSSQLYLTEFDPVESYIDEVLINPNKDGLTQFITLSTVIILMIILVKLHLNGNDNFWPERGVVFLSTSESRPFLDVVRGRLGWGSYSSQKKDTLGVYKRLEEKKFCGLMEAGRPVFFVKDVDLARRILCEDADHFVNRQRKFVLEKIGPQLIMEMLSELTAPEWEKIRTVVASQTMFPDRSTPTTTTSEAHLSGKMFSQFNSRAAQLVEMVRRESKKRENHTDGISVTECFGRFTMDVIAMDEKAPSSGTGGGSSRGETRSSTLTEKELPFYKHRKMFQSLGLWRMVKVFIAFHFPRAAALFRVSYIEQESTHFFKNIVQHTINHRKNNEKAYNIPSSESVLAGEQPTPSPGLRPDFLQLFLFGRDTTRDKEMKIDEADLKQSLMTRVSVEPTPPVSLKKPGKSCNETTSPDNATPSSQAFFVHHNDGLSNTGNKLYLTDELIFAQLSLFTEEINTVVSHLLYFSLYVLALHPECQEKLFSEIKQYLQEGRGDHKNKTGILASSLDSGAINSMEYMDMLMNETLRMFPLVVREEMICTTEYQLGRADLDRKDGRDDTNLIRLPEETLVVIPIIAFHNDERYFPDPDKFIVERFSPENRNKLEPYSFIPFGYGPQNRITTKLGLVGTKTALAHLVYNFIIETTSSTPVAKEYDNFSPLLKPVRMMKIRFRERK